jgi:hypothetical protein
VKFRVQAKHIRFLDPTFTYYNGRSVLSRPGLYPRKGATLASNSNSNEFEKWASGKWFVSKSGGPFVSVQFRP